MRFSTVLIFIITSLFGACYKGPNPIAEPDTTAGKRAFGSVAPADSRQYLLEQQAILKANLDEKGVTIERQEYKLIVNIPGNVGFTINSSDINWNLHQILDGISPVLKEFPNTDILIIGHSDGRGDPELNKMLSQQRAESIRRYLVRSNIDAERLSIKGVGQKEQLTSNRSTLNRSLNRRITLEIRIKQG